MDDVARAALCDLVARYGTRLADDPRRTAALPRDVAGDHKLAITLIGAAALEGVGTYPRETDSGSADARIAQLTRRLEQHRGLTPAAVRWAAESWALALAAPSIPPPCEPAKPAPRPPAPISIAVVVVGVLVAVGLFIAVYGFGSAGRAPGGAEKLTLTRLRSGRPSCVARTRPRLLLRP
jgi:hypothetical protein